MISRLRISRLAGALLCVLAAAACSNPADAGEKNTPGIRVVSAPTADSVLAAPAQPLVVEVRDSAGKVRAGVQVQLAAVFVVRANGASTPSMWVGTPDGDFRPATTVTTDASGRVSVPVIMGRVAGEGRLTLAAPALGFTGAATFTIRPGTPVQLRVSPADSALYVGRGYALRTHALDLAGNAVPATGVTYAVEGAAATVDGGTLTGRAVGRVRVVARAGAMEAVAFASVVPQGTLLAARADGLYLFGLDGSEYRRVVAADGARSPRWFPDGQRFVYSVALYNAFVGDLTGATRFLLPSADRYELTSELWAHPSRDGEWVYFGGYREFFANLYRVRLDGTRMSLVPGFTPDGNRNGHPSPSPTGDRVAYFREMANSGETVVRVQSTATGAVLAEVPGHAPEWSHGDSIAFLDTRGMSAGPVRIMAADGGGLRSATADPERLYHFGLDWSPDDRWIVARATDYDRLELIEVATGRTLPLAYSSGLSDAAWRP